MQNNRERRMTSQSKVNLTPTHINHTPPIRHTHTHLISMFNQYGNTSYIRQRTSSLQTARTDLWLNWFPRQYVLKASHNSNRRVLQKCYVLLKVAQRHPFSPHVFNTFRPSLSYLDYLPVMLPTQSALILTLTNSLLYDHFLVLH